MKQYTILWVENFDDPCSQQTFSDPKEVAIAVEQLLNEGKNTLTIFENFLAKKPD
jgi:hypothetical protein